VTYSKHGSFFCDCGAREDGNCKVKKIKMILKTGVCSEIRAFIGTVFVTNCFIIIINSHCCQIF